MEFAQFDMPGSPAGTASAPHGTSQSAPAQKDKKGTGARQKATGRTEKNSRREQKKETGSEAFRFSVPEDVLADFELGKIEAGSRYALSAELTAYATGTHGDAQDMQPFSMRITAIEAKNKPQDGQDRDSDEAFFHAVFEGGL